MNMSQRKRRSTSSTPTAKSKRFDDIVCLGKRLVEELGMETCVDTLGRWMAHYISELIESVDQAKDSTEKLVAQERCCKAILELWEHRSALPHGARPLGYIQNVLKAIQSIRENETVIFKGLGRLHRECGDPWVQFALMAEETGLALCRIATLTAIAEAQFGKEKRWVDENSEMLSKDEKALIGYIDDWLEYKMLWKTEKESVSIGSLDPKERRSRVLGEIKASLDALSESFGQLTEKVQ